MEGSLPAEHLLHYREANSKLPGHPELGLTPGVKFSSGRLGHMWALVNGVAMANKDKVVFCLGSDGSQQEGNDAEAARLAVAQKLNVKLLIDDNDVTIAGHPSEYLKGYSLPETLTGHGLKVWTVQGEDIDALWSAVAESVLYDGPTAGRYSFSYSFITQTNKVLFVDSCLQASHGPRCEEHPRLDTRPRCYPCQSKFITFQENSAVCAEPWLTGCN